MLAHEIKHPLSGVRGAAQLLGPSDLTELFVAEVDRVAALIDRMQGVFDTRSLELGAENICPLPAHARQVALVGKLLRDCRRAGPFVAINMAAIPRELIEAMLARDGGDQLRAARALGLQPQHSAQAPPRPRARAGATGLDQSGLASAHIVVSRQHRSG